MATTNYSMNLMTAAESWRAVRTIRAEPQGSLGSVLAGDRVRRREFHMALEQAQQQFSAAERIGYESRPLNLFYGLAQAGRALSAGSAALGKGTDQQWQARGHGLDYDVTAPAGVLGTSVERVGGTRDLFSRASIATGSPRDFSAEKFGAVMNQLVDYTMVFGEHEDYAGPISDVNVYPSANSFPLKMEIRVPGLAQGQATPLSEVKTLLARYPALRRLAVAENDEGGVLWSPNMGKCFVIVENPEDLEPRGGSGIRVLRGSTIYRRSTVLLPSVGQSDEPLRPLMAWWMVLFALSMLARYAPSIWTQTLSLTDSPIASRIEFVLDAALDAVPELLWGELHRLQ